MSSSWLSRAFGSPSDSFSAKFLEAYNALPPESQQSLIESHLFALLDAVPKERAKELLATASDLQKNTPNLKAKRKELENLCDLFIRDSKIGFTKERSQRDEILDEILNSVVSHLQSVWHVVYEDQLCFGEAHQSLLFIAQIVRRLNNAPIHPESACNCASPLIQAPFKFEIKRTSGKVVKQFRLSSTRLKDMDKVLLWTWRECFVSMVAANKAGQITPMLEDIEALLGWPALERMLYGGRYDNPGDGYESTDYETDDGYYEDSDYADSDCSDPESEPSSSSSSTPSLASHQRCTCAFHAPHWSSTYNTHRIHLVNLVSSVLFSIFSITPSLRLYNSLLAISFDTDSESMRSRLLKAIQDIALNSADNLVAALDIYSDEEDLSKLLALFHSPYIYILRPRDATPIQVALLTLSTEQFHLPFVHTLLEKYITATMKDIHAAVLSSFSTITSPTAKDELVRIIKLPSGSQQRMDRIDRWVSSVTTPGPGTGGPGGVGMNPVALAAMMMGFPAIEFEEGEEGLVGALLDSSPHSHDDEEFDEDDEYEDEDGLGGPGRTDWDLHELREEFRPPLKARFDTWITTAQSIKGGCDVLFRLYDRAIMNSPATGSGLGMTYIQAPDILEEMMSRVNDRPSKRHVADAMDALGRFGKLVRKLRTARAEARAKNRTKAGVKAKAKSKSVNAASGNSKRREDRDEYIDMPPLEPVLNIDDVD